MSGKPLGVQFLNPFDLEAEPLNQQGTGTAIPEDGMIDDAGTGDLNSSNDRIAGMVDLSVSPEIKGRRRELALGAWLWITTSKNGKARWQHWLSLVVQIYGRSRY